VARLSDSAYDCPMEGADLLFAVLGPVLAGILATAGYGAISVTPPDFKKAKICFVLAAACLGGIPVVWGFTTVHPFWARLLITTVFGAVAVSGLTEALRWVTGREVGFTQHVPAKTENPPASAVEARSSLSPGDRDRLSTAVYQLSDIFTKQAPPILRKARGFAGPVTGPPNDAQKALQVLQELEADTSNLYSAIWGKLLPDHSYYRPDLEKIVPDDITIQSFRTSINGYLRIAESVDGLPPNKVSQILQIPHSALLKSTLDFEAWLRECDARISQMRQSLR